MKIKKILFRDAFVGLGENKMIGNAGIYLRGMSFFS